MQDGLDDIELYEVSIQIRNLKLIWEGILTLHGEGCIAVPINIDQTGSDYVIYWCASVGGGVYIPIILASSVILSGAGAGLDLSIKKVSDAAIIHQSKQIMSGILRNHDSDSFNEKMIDLYKFINVSLGHDFYDFLKESKVAL
jgi:hypothetical protein